MNKRLMLFSLQSHQCTCGHTFMGEILMQFSLLTTSHTCGAITIFLARLSYFRVKVRWPKVDKN